MDNCTDIHDMLPDYLNHATTKAQNAQIVRHISVCPGCREALALWIAAQQAAKDSAEDVPEDILGAMFAKLPGEENTELARILESGSITMAGDLIRYAFETVRATYKLARLF